MIPLLERIKQPKALVADGAMGTMLIPRGLKDGDFPERFNLKKPEVLEEIAREYLNAGAEIIQTNTFGASPLKLASVGLAEKTEEINSRAVQAVRKAVSSRAYISASCGPTGKLLEPFGDVKPEEMAESYLRQTKILIEEGVDAICVETMTDLNEAVLAIHAAKKTSPSIPVFATMTFDATPRGFFTIMGVTIEQAVKGLADAGADVIGTNCGNGIVNMVNIIREMKKFTSLPLMVQSNAGIPVLKNEKLIYPETPEFMARHVPELLNLGVKIIGGCCGTTPVHIAMIRRAVDDYYSSAQMH
jgi:5-methyltetrahydrofolate--homocysteine methyltransferase